MRRIIGGTDPGLVRANNQDRFEYAVLSDNLAFAVLCDGMGGENGGQVASELAAGFAREALSKELAEGMGEVSLRAVLMTVFAGANAVVREAAAKNEDLAGMGTTMIVAIISGNQLFAAYVGDSRVYRVAEKEEKQLTHDHTVVQMLVDIGEITPQDAAQHPQRHYITRAVGASDVIDADFLVEDLAEGDRILLCSDGLYNYLQPGGLPALVEQCLGEGSTDSLIQIARDGGGADNITAVVMA